MSPFLALLLVALYSLLSQPNDKGPAIKVGGTSYVLLQVKNMSDTVKIQSSYWPLLRCTKEFFTEEYLFTSDSTCIIMFDTSIAARYYLQVGKDASVPIFLVPDDTLEVTLDYNNGQKIEEIVYDGVYAQISKYLYDKPQNITFNRAAAHLFNDPFRLKTPEETLLLYKVKSDSVAQMQQKYLHTKKSLYNLPAWFVRHEENEAALFAAYHQLMIAAYWKMFFNVNVKIPEGYYDSISPIDITSGDARFSLIYYLYVAKTIGDMLQMEKQERALMDSLGAQSLDELKGTKAYIAYRIKAFKAISEKADELLPDELYRPFVTGYFFQAVAELGPADCAKILDYLKTKLHATDYLAFILKHYELTYQRLTKGQPAPDFYLLSDQQEEFLSLAHFKGKVLLLNFWFPGCKPCLQEIPHEKKLMTEYGDKGFTIVNICIEATVKLWEATTKKYDFAGVNVVTQGAWKRRLKEAYTVGAIPHYVLIDQEGKIIENQTFKPSDPRLADLIKAALYSKK